MDFATTRVALLISKRTVRVPDARGVYAIQTMEQMHHEKIGGKVFAGT